MLRAQPLLQAPALGAVVHMAGARISTGTPEMWDTRVRYCHGTGARGLGVPAPRAAQPSPGKPSSAREKWSEQPQDSHCLRAGLPARAGHPEKGALAGQPGRSPAARTTAGPSPPKRARPSAQCRDGTVPSVTCRFNWTSPGMLRACGHRLQVGIHSNRSSVETR